MKFSMLAGIALFAMLGCAGCSSTGTATKPASPPLEGSAWVLSSLPGRSLVPGATPTARFETGRVFGTDGCNRYSMPFRAQGTEIEIGPIGASTKMACPENIMAQAQAFTAALLNARRFRHGAGTLELLDTRGDVLATFTAQAQSLAGTSWTVRNINNGRQAVVSVATGSTVTMAFDANGRVYGTTGANQYTGAYSADGDALHFSNVAATLRASADPAIDEQEQAFLRAVKSVANMRFEGDRLEMRSADGAIAIMLERS